MIDDFKEAMEQLKEDVNAFCKQYGPKLNEVLIYLEILDNLELITEDSIEGFDNLEKRIRTSIGERNYNAILFFVSRSSGTANHIIVRIGFFQNSGKWFAWM